MDSKTASGAAAGAAALWLLAELCRGGVPWTAGFALSLALLWALRERGGWARRPQAAVFLAAFALYLSTFRWRGGDDIPMTLLPFALLKHGTLTLDQVLDPWLTGKTGNFTVLLADGRRLSIFPVVGSLMSLPVFLVPAACGTLLNETFLHNLSKVSASAITALSAVLLHRLLSRRCSRAWALALTALYGAGTWCFSVSSQALWQHGPAQLAAAIGLWGLEDDRFRGDVLAGAGLALAFAARPDSAFFLAAAGLYILLAARRRLCGFVIGASIPLACLAAYWLHYTGRLRPPESGFQAPLFLGLQPQALLGLAASPTRGLLFFFPAALFGFWGALRPGRYGRRPDHAPWLAAAVAGPWLLLSCYYPWTGGMTFGPRYFAVPALFLSWCCAPIEDDVRSRPPLLWAFCAALSFSVLTHAAGAYLEWPGSEVIDAQRAQVWDWTLHPVAFLFSAEGGAGRPPGAPSDRAGLGRGRGRGLACGLAQGQTPPGALRAGLQAGGF